MDFQRIFILLGLAVTAYLIILAWNEDYGSGRKVVADLPGGTEFITDNGNQIIDVHNLPIEVPFELEEKINNIPGVVENGIFSNRKADVIIKAKETEVELLTL